MSWVDQSMNRLKSSWLDITLIVYKLLRLPSDGSEIN